MKKRSLFSSKNRHIKNKNYLRKKNKYFTDQKFLRKFKKFAKSDEPKKELVRMSHGEENPDVATLTSPY
ncbi:hypothetical protein PCYB_145110 [Plasmodium cynomolgi strain B]|uniref:Uncharacterized protein n=1 Tax=Plasmodium cynomolgi (strain B) TaxID=1120755 RepID=K6UN19_PLACD|nr:hypothetical protein PCYB_145110 [Plasmodium cynomolgi strain B]GAB69083.1 hypothetical protein PCYB_145110 [Plasmodium cynomolgi strain B]